MPAGKEVAIVLDRGFGEKLAELARSQSVWAWDSTANRAAAQGLWDAGVVPGQVTVFTAAHASSAEEAFVDILGTIDLHHPAWGQLRVIGVEPTPTIRGAILEYGAGGYQEIATGFVFKRPLAD